MKALLSVFFILSFSLFSFAQDFSIQWQNCFGASPADEGRDIIEVEGGYLIGGGTQSPSSTNYHGQGEFWVIRTNYTGEVIWERCYGGSGGEIQCRILYAGNNNYYLIGNTNSVDGDVSDNPYGENGGYWIVKIDNEGNIIWDRVVGGNNYEHPYTATSTPDGGVITYGWTSSSDGDISINHGLYDAWMIKLSSEGETMWDFSIGTQGQDAGQAIISTSDGGLLAASNSYMLGSGNIECESHGNSDAVLFKLDSEANVEWQQCYGGSEHDGIIGLLEIEDGYIFTAYSSSDDGDLEGLNYQGEDDAWVVKIDFQGNIIWQNLLGGSDYDHFYLISKESDGGYRLFGRTESHNGDVVGNHSIPNTNSNDIWIVKIDSIGNLVSQQCIGGEGTQVLRFGVLPKGEHGYIIAGNTEGSFTGDVECGSGGLPDVWLFEIQDCAYATLDTPELPSGPDTVCNDTYYSTYTVPDVPYAVAYEWAYSPLELGELDFNDNEAYLIWNNEYVGEASLQVRSLNQCDTSDWSEPILIQVDECSGITENNLASRIKVYPNPAKSYITIDIAGVSSLRGGTTACPDIMGKQSVSKSDENYRLLRHTRNDDKKPVVIAIYNLFGQKVIEVPITRQKTRWDVSGLARGIYFYQLLVKSKVLQGKIILN